MMIGNGPPRSGWLMNVVVLPSLVGISICWSIMAMLFPVHFVGRSPLITIAGESQPERAPSCPAPLLRCTVRIAILGDIHQRRLAMTQTSNRFFDEIGRLMNDAA